jgi:hypothetical protein
MVILSKQISATIQPNRSNTTLKIAREWAWWNEIERRNGKKLTRMAGTRTK